MKIKIDVDLVIGCLNVIGGLIALVLAFIEHVKFGMCCDLHSGILSIWFLGFI